MEVNKSSSDVSVYVNLLSTAGVPATGVPSSDIEMSFTRYGSTHSAIVSASSFAGGLGSSHIDNSAQEVSSTAAPGQYRTDWPDVPFSSGVVKGRPIESVVLCINSTQTLPAQTRVILVSSAAKANVTQWRSSGASSITAIAHTSDVTADTAAITALINANATIQNISPVTTDSDIEVVQFDDYANADSRAITWSSTAGSWHGGDITGATVEMAVENRETHAYTIYSGTIVQATATQQVRVDLASSQTAIYADGGKLYRFHTRTVGGPGGSTRVITIATGDFGVIASLFRSTD